ncbi:hypothetical protein [Chitinolyticbacter meiyuanensis]|uniref:hypothetical protein n=1 Tax=Chitinolyticbacter meiyuanensis TaxID=682798 RepID=UPI0011E5B180|nr:hypothetical protein [Chitinolyticbacter meiyuanensis]
MSCNGAGGYRAGLLLALLCLGQASPAIAEQSYPGETRVVPKALALDADIDGFEDGESRQLAAAGCRKIRLDGYPTPPCLYAYTSGQALHLWFNPSQPNERKLAISSWYHSNRLGPLALFSGRAPLLSLTTTGVRGTGVHQRLWLLLGAEAARCRPLLLETLSAHQWVIGDADYRLTVMPTLQAGRLPRIVIDYELRRVPNDDGESRVTHRWRDTLRWQATTQRFELLTRSGQPFAPAVAEIDVTRARLSRLDCGDFDTGGKAWQMLPIMSVLDGVSKDLSASPQSD